MPSRSYRHFIRKLFLLDGKNKGQNNKYTEVTASASELNIMDGVTATAAEINELDAAVLKVGDVTATATEVNATDGATATNDTTGKTAILTTGGALQLSGDLATLKNIGLAGGTPGVDVTPSEGGYGARHTTKLVLTALDIGAIAAMANEAIGVLLYTFPATGDILVHHSGINFGITGEVAVAADTPDVGLGTVIGTGAVATLDGTPAFEDVATGVTWTTGTMDGTDQISHAIATAGVDLVLTKGAANKVHLNIADGWAAASATNLVTGYVWIDWSIRTY